MMCSQTASHFVDGQVATTDSDGVAIAQALIKAGAKIDFQDKDGETALMRAVANQKVPLVQVLVGANANRDIRNNEGQTAEMVATLSHDEANELEILTKKAADLKSVQELLKGTCPKSAPKRDAGPS
jgi:ankyrin repeat protein